MVCRCFKLRTILCIPQNVSLEYCAVVDNRSRCIVFQGANAPDIGPLITREYAGIHVIIRQQTVRSGAALQLTERQNPPRASPSSNEKKILVLKEAPTPTTCEEKGSLSSSSDEEETALVVLTPATAAKQAENTRTIESLPSSSSSSAVRLLADPIPETRPQETTEGDAYRTTLERKHHKISLKQKIVLDDSRALEALQNQARERTEPSHTVDLDSEADIPLLAESSAMDWLSREQKPVAEHEAESMNEDSSIPWPSLKLDTERAAKVGVQTPSMPKISPIRTVIQASQAYRRAQGKPR